MKEGRQGQMSGLVGYLNPWVDTKTAVHQSGLDASRYDFG